MITKKFSFWILPIIFGCALCDIELNGPCKIRHLDGICQKITSCKFAMTVLSLHDIQTLRSMFCGFEGTLPKVCCPIVNKKEDPAIANPTSTPTPTTITTPTATNIITVPNENHVVENEVITTQKPLPTVDPFVLPSRDVCGRVFEEDKIFGGDIAEIDEFPWLARISFFNPTTRKDMFACSGTLISDRYVLTAAHCLGVYKINGVRLGEWDAESHIDCQNGYCNDGPTDIIVDKVRVYPTFNKKNLTSGDIALLRLRYPVNFTDFIRPACLPTTDFIAKQDYIDSTYTTAGWGKTELGAPSVLLRKVKVDAVPYSICKTAMPGLSDTDDPHVICAGGKTGRDSCQGDSGGPLLRVVGENYKQNWYVYGIISHGVKQCGTAGKPAIYTRVSKYMNWILETISEG